MVKRNTANLQIAVKDLPLTQEEQQVIWEMFHEILKEYGD